MKFKKRPGLSGRDIQLLVLIGLVSAAVLGTLIGADIQLSRSVAGGGGLYAPWEGVRALLFRNAPPYGYSATAAAQQQAYGRPAQPGENPYIPSLPFFLMLTYFPLAAIPDPATTRGIWMFASEAALVGTAFMSLRLVEWRPRRWFQIGFSLLAVFGFYPVIALLEGGPAVMLGLLYTAVLVAYGEEQDELAGALLVFTLFAWEIGLLFVMLVLWKAWYDKRMRILAGFGMTLLVLVIVSFLIYPGWLLPFATAAMAMLRADFGTTSRELLLKLWPAYGLRAAQGLTIVGVVLMLFEWAATRQADFRRFAWAACLTLALTPLIGLRTEATNLVVLFPSTALILSAIANRWRAGYVVAGLLLLVAFLLPWAWFVRWTWLHEVRYQDYLVLFPPLTTIIGLYWTRWWFLRPPRTWFDQVRTALEPGGRWTEKNRSITMSR